MWKFWETIHGRSTNRQFHTDLLAVSPCLHSSYLERKEFLERTDMRQFEAERDLRLKMMNSKRWRPRLCGASACMQGLGRLHEVTIMCWGLKRMLLTHRSWYLCIWNIHCVCLWHFFFHKNVLCVPVVHVLRTSERHVGRQLSVRQFLLLVVTVCAEKYVAEQSGVSKVHLLVVQIAASFLF